MSLILGHDPMAGLGGGGAGGYRTDTSFAVTGTSYTITVGAGGSGGAGGAGGLGGSLAGNGGAGGAGHLACPAIRRLCCGLRGPDRGGRLGHATRMDRIG